MVAEPTESKLGGLLLLASSSSSSLLLGVTTGGSSSLLGLLVVVVLGNASRGCGIVFLGGGCYSSSLLESRSACFGGG